MLTAPTACAITPACRSTPHGKKLGVLNVADTDWRELSGDDLRLHTIGDLFSITIERARLFARSRQIGVSEERGRLAREIHDTLGQKLAAITFANGDGRCPV